MVEKVNHLINLKIKECIQNNITIVCAAGNEGPTGGSINYPGALPEVIAVGSLKNDTHLSDFSSRGPTGAFRMKPDVVVIGDSIVIV